MVEHYSHTWYALTAYVDYYREQFPGPYQVHILGMGRPCWYAVMDDFGNLVEVRP